MNLRGFLNLHKPSGRTSRDVVNRVDWLVRPAKAGHAGTLDPLASGVLVVAVGAATRLIEYVQTGRKRYTGTFLLGRHSPTEDTDGQVVELVDPPRPTAEELAAAALRFVGRIEQQPPAYSALKVKGKRAYKLAREGKPVELAPRPIEIYRLAVARYAYPELVLDIESSGGTYVRSLGRDLARSLATEAVMSALVRTAVGSFRIEDALKLEELSPEGLPALLRPALAAVEHLPRVTLAPEEVARIFQGQSIARPELAETDEAAAVDAAGELVSILAPRGKGIWKPRRNFKPE